MRKLEWVQFMIMFLPYPLSLRTYNLVGAMIRGLIKEAGKKWCKVFICLISISWSHRYLLYIWFKLASLDFPSFQYLWFILLTILGWLKHQNFKIDSTKARRWESGYKMRNLLDVMLSSIPFLIKWASCSSIF